MRPLLILLALSACAHVAPAPTITKEEREEEEREEPERIRPDVHVPGLSDSLTVDGIYCGADRVLIKHMIDPEAGDVDLTPLPVETVHAIASAAAPDWHKANPRGTYEKHVHRVSGTITAIGAQKDHDIHFVLTGSDGSTMVVEMVHPTCSKDSPVVKQIEAVRAKWIKAHGNPPSSITGGYSIPVTITGVGFYDKIDHGSGHADNGAELHPVLDVEFQ